MSQTALLFLFPPPVHHAWQVLGVLTKTLHAVPLHESEVVESVHTQFAIELPIPEMNTQEIKSSTVKNIKKIKEQQCIMHLGSHTFKFSVTNTLSKLLQNSCSMQNCTVKDGHSLTCEYSDNKM
jgi:hypothetical protein